MNTSNVFLVVNQVIMIVSQDAVVPISIVSIHVIQESVISSL